MVKSGAELQCLGWVFLSPSVCFGAKRFYEHDTEKTMNETLAKMTQILRSAER